MSRNNERNIEKVAKQRYFGKCLKNEIKYVSGII